MADSQGIGMNKRNADEDEDDKDNSILKITIGEIGSLEQQRESYSTENQIHNKKTLIRALQQATIIKPQMCCRVEDVKQRKNIANSCSQLFIQLDRV